MPSVSVLVRNALSNWAVFAANIATTLVLSPIVVRELGASQYGIWLLVTAVTGYLGLIEAGVTVSTGRFLNYHIGRKDTRSAEATVSTALAFYVTVAAFLLLAVALFSLPISSLATPELGLDGRTLLLLVILQTANVGGTFMAAVFAQLLHAENRFDLKNGVLLLGLLFRFIATILVFRYGGGLYELACVQVVSTLLTLILLASLARRFGPGLKLGPKAVSRSAFAEIFGFGKWAFVNNIASRIDGQSGVILTGVFLTPKAVAHFGVAQMLVEYGVQLVQNIVAVAVPDLTKSAGRGDLNSIRHFVAAAGQVSAFFAVPLLIGVAFLGPAFVTLWMGAEFADAAHVMVILVLAKSCFVMSSPLGMGIWAMGRVRAVTVSSLLTAAAGVLLSVILLRQGGYGFEVIALGTLCTAALQWLFLQTWVGLRLLDLTAGWFLKHVVWPFFLAAAVFSAITTVVMHSLPASSWVEFVGLVAVVMLLYVPLAATMLWGIRRSVRSFIRVWSHAVGIIFRRLR
jgi:O-antigen/teichoic acid export membrane protein